MTLYIANNKDRPPSASFEFKNIEARILNYMAIIGVIVNI